MSAAMHTPEPWRTECWASHAPRSVVADLDPAEPTEIYGQNVLWLGRIHIAECEGSRRDGGNEANAARIVACVNFCAGLTNEQLSATDGAIHGYEKFVALAAQRDELLSALKAVNAALTQNATLPADVELARNTARHAITEAKS